MERVANGTSTRFRPDVLAHSRQYLTPVIANRSSSTATRRLSCRQLLRTSIVPHTEVRSVRRGRRGRSSLLCTSKTVAYKSKLKRYFGPLGLTASS